MIATVLLAAALAAPVPIPREAWAEPQDTFRTVDAFRVHVEVHGQGAVATALGERAQRQIEASLRRDGIAVVAAPGVPSLEPVGAVVLDLHVVTADQALAIAWSLHASQIVHLRSGAFAFASTWEVGDLLYGPAAGAAARLEASLQPAIDELDQHFAASRPAPRAAPPPPSPPPAAEPPEGRAAEL